MNTAAVCSCPGLFALNGMRIMSSPSWNNLSECKP